MQMRLWRFLALTGEPLKGKGGPDIQEKFEISGRKFEILAKSLKHLAKSLEMFGGKFEHAGGIVNCCVANQPSTHLHAAANGFSQPGPRAQGPGPRFNFRSGRAVWSRLRLVVAGPGPMPQASSGGGVFYRMACVIDDSPNETSVGLVIDSACL